MTLSPLPDVAGPGLLIGIYALGIGILCVLFLLIVVIESAVLQFMRWGSFRRSLRGSFLMNLASTLVGFFFLALLPQWKLLGILVAWALSVLIEGLVLLRLQRDAGRRNWTVALVANLVSYAILIVPAYLFAPTD
ncbi:MAG: hypothetical protein AB1894_12600 [Chloroflexota bacterium]